MTTTVRATFGAALALFVLAAAARASDAPAGRYLEWRPQVVARTWRGCVRDSANCTWVSFEYPQFTDGPPALVDSLNRHLRELLTHGWVPPGSGAGPAEAADLFISAYDHEKASEDSEYWVAPEYLEASAELVGDTLGVVTLEVRWSSYGGGAHGGHTLQLAMHDAATGRPLSLPDILIPGGVDSLTARAEPRFRAARGMAPGVGLAEAGMWFEQDRFHLAANTALTRAGLLVFYNEYEVASYAEGPTEIVLPWSEVSPFLRRAPR